MSKENKSSDIVQQYIKEGKLDKLRDILEASRKKVKELEEAVSQVEENKLLKAYRTGDKSYIKKILNEMSENNQKKSNKKEEIKDEKEEEKEEEEWSTSGGFAGY